MNRIKFTLSAVLAAGAAFGLSSSFETPVFAQVQVQSEAAVTATFSSGQGGVFAGGTTSRLVELPHPAPLHPSEIPTVVPRAGYTFTGWFLDGRYISESSLLRTVLTGSHYIEAAYERAAFNLVISAGDHGQFENGALQADRPVLVDDILGTMPAVLAEPGWTFAGWEINGTIYTSQQAAGLTMPAFGLTATAVYDQDPMTVRVSFEAGSHGQLADGTQSVFFEQIPSGSGLQELAIPGVEAAAGWEFAGWSLNGGDKLLTNEDVRALVADVEDMVFTAVYRQLPAEDSTPEVPGESETPDSGDGAEDVPGSGSDQVGDDVLTEDDSNQPVKDTEAWQDDKAAKTKSPAHVPTAAVSGFLSFSGLAAAASAALCGVKRRLK